MNELHLVESYACDCDSFKINSPLFSKIDFSVVGPGFAQKLPNRQEFDGVFVQRGLRRGVFVQSATGYSAQAVRTRFTQ
jgi:hypothetical protein